MLLALLLSLAPQSPIELRAALDALREGAPGEPDFEAALPRLPELLAAPTSWFVAGAAHLAGEHGRAECAAALVAALERESRRPAAESRWSRGALLDALVRLDVAAPADALLARPDRELAEQVYLALACEDGAERRADGFARLLELGWDSTEAHQAAACRLTARRDPRAARWLIAGAPWLVRLALREPGSEDEIATAFGGGRWSSAHAIWPPRVQCALALPGPAEPLDAITHVRRASGRSGPAQTTLFSHELIAWRARLLDALLERDAALDLAAVTRYHDGEDAASLARALGELLDEVRLRIRAAAEALAAEGLLPDVEQELARLSFRVELHDLRADRTTAPEWPRSSAGVECVPR